MSSFFQISTLSCSTDYSISADPINDNNYGKTQSDQGFSSSNQTAGQQMDVNFTYFRQVERGYFGFAHHNGLNAYSVAMQWFTY